MNFNLIDITERMLSKNYLEDQEHYLKTIIDSVQTGIIIIDPKTRKIVGANPMAIKMMGATKETLIGSFCHNYICMAEPGQCPVIDLDQPIDNSERILQKANGEKLNIIKTVTKIMIHGEEHLLESFIDITDKKQLEAQLRHAQKMEAVSTLAGGIAHDFNNVLQIISGYAQLMLMGKNPNDPDCTALKIIEKSAQKACNLTKQLQIYGREMKSRFLTMDLNRELLNINSLLNQILLKMIHIKFHLADDLKTIKGDPSQLEQIIMNLAINARDAMPEGGELTFQTKNTFLDKKFCVAHPWAKMGEYVLLNVSDSGVGMDAEILKNIFQPFFTTKEMGKGTGLGLAMVYSIVKNHGGYIICDSTPGYGTVFKIFFPIVAQGIGEIDNLKKKQQEIKKLPNGVENILFVDDEKAILTVGDKILNQFGYKVITVENGEAAIETCIRKKGCIDLVILDLDMPGMGGYKCLNRLLEIDPKIKIIISSGYTTKEKIKGTLDSGAVGFIKKPYRLDDLLSYVRKILDK